MIVKVGNERIKFPDSMSETEIQAVLQKQFSPQQSGPQPKPEADRGIMGYVEPAMSVASSMLAEPVAGLAGLATLGGGAEFAADNVASVRDAMTYEPRTAEGKEGLRDFADTLSPVTEALEGAENAIGDAAYDAAGGGQFGAVAGAIGKTAPTAIMEAFGLKLARSGKAANQAAKNIRNAVPDAESQALLDAGQRMNVPVMTSDVRPPDTFLGKQGQQLSEKMGVMGSGSQRVSQQDARIAAVKSMADEFNVDAASPVADEMFKSLQAKNREVMTKAGGMRKEAISALEPLGVVPLRNTVTALQDQLKQQSRLGPRANTELIKILEDTFDAADQKDFGIIADVRSELIKDIKAVEGVPEKAKFAGSMEQVKKGIDLDLADFAKTKHRDAAAKWAMSNRMFADELQKTRRTELRRILNGGESTPEKILPLLRGGKRSELERLYGSLTPDGRVSGKRAIIKDVLDETGFFTGDANPNRVATSLGKKNRQQAIDVFFKGQAKKEIEGVRRLLESTRRAQDASLSTATGQQLFMPVVGGGAGFAMASMASLPTTLATAGAVSAILKLYETPRFRNLLLRLSNTKKGTTPEMKTLELVWTAVQGELQAAKTKQEQKR